MDASTGLQCKLCVRVDVRVRGILIRCTRQDCETCDYQNFQKYMNKRCFELTSDFSLDLHPWVSLLWTTEGTEGSQKAHAAPVHGVGYRQLQA